MVSSVGGTQFFTANFLLAPRSHRRRYTIPTDPPRAALQRSIGLFGGQPPARGSPRDLTIGIDAGEIDGPVWSVSDRATAGAFRSSRAADRKYCRPHARPFRLGFPRDGWSVSG